MLNDNAAQLRKRLKTLGLSDPAINAAWPMWWSDDADASSSARAELRYSIARKLGLDPHSLLEDDNAPRFTWKEEARFKHLSGESDIEKWAITSFGTALGAILVSGTNVSSVVIGQSAGEIRAAILANQSYVRLVDLLSVCWAIGIPTIHLRVFPWRQKRMAAMSVSVGGRHAILLGKDSFYPAQIAFYLAHELAHISLGHLLNESVIVDLESYPNPDPPASRPDPEEVAADEFALELLTGDPQPVILPVAAGGGAQSLARAALGAAAELRIEPGTLAMCFGYSSGDWATAIASLRYIYSSAKPVWQEVNNIAMRQLSLSSLPDDTLSYLRNVLGEPA
ncbi:MAG TPA: hypothetical protein VEW46_16075 [Pyrinomonadaceae bacterium]|nr:hypothetical protein [Pyrinomonadaceae bacterium]